MEHNQDDDFLKRTDLLSLKKLVIDEIKNDFELKGQAHRGAIGQPGYVDPFTRLEQTYQDQKTENKVHIGGHRPLDDDEDSQIIINANRAKAYVDSKAHVESTTSI